MTRGLPRILGALLLGLFAAKAGAGDDELKKPVLRINSPFAGSIWRADVDEAGTFVVVSNSDKAATIFNLDNPRDRITARAPIRREQQRPAHAVAISPDARLIAYGVPPEVDDSEQIKPATSAIYVMNRDGASRIIRILSTAEDDIPSRPQALRFSPDGKYLAGVFSAGCGLRIWSTETWKLWAKDDKGYAGGDPASENCFRQSDPVEGEKRPQTVAVQFFDEKEGRPWLITSGDTGLRAYDRSGQRLIPRMPAFPKVDIDIDRPAGLATSPDGRLMLVGDQLDRTLPPPIRFRIAIVDPATLKLVGKPLIIRETALLSDAYLSDHPAVRGNKQLSLDRVAWVKHRDKEYFYGAGAFYCSGIRRELMLRKDQFSDKELCMARWERGRETQDPAFIPIGADRVTDLLALHKRNGLFLVTQRNLGIVDVDGVPIKQPDSGPVLFDYNTSADFRGPTREFKISEDGRVVSFDDYRSWSKEPVRLTFDLNTLKATPGPGHSLANISPDQDPNIVKEWDDNTTSTPKILERRLEGDGFPRNEWHRSAAVQKSKFLVLLGSNQFLRLVSYEEEGTPKVLCGKNISSDAYRVNITRDASIAVTGHGDGTLRWYRLNFDPTSFSCQFELLVSVYLDETRSGRWSVTAWRPNGFFWRDSNARMDLLEWQLAGQDGQILRVPWTHGRVLRFYSEDEVRKALAAPPPRRTPEEISKEQSPDATVLACRATLVSLESPPDRRLQNETDRIALSVASGCGWPKRLDIRMANDAPVIKTVAGREYGAYESVILEKTSLEDGLVNVDIKLPAGERATKGDKQICFYVDDGFDSCAVVEWVGSTIAVKKKRFWAVMAGISGHKSPKMTLRFAANDVLDLAKLFIDDFRERTAGNPVTIPPDFDELHMDIAVAPHPDADDEEIKEFATTNPDIVERFAPTRVGILSALDDIRTQVHAANDKEPGKDLFLFQFSGHGGANPYSQETGLTIFATKDTEFGASKENIEKTALTSKEILDAIGRIPGQKIILLDACRSLADIPNALPFDSGNAREEFNRSLSAHIFLSSGDGQESRETPELYFNPNRPEQLRGNSVFTYAFLRSLDNDSGAAFKNPVSGVKQIFIDLIASYLTRDLFSDENANSTIRQVATKEGWPVFPQPLYVPARVYSPQTVLRTLYP